jgi:hypothetical protein
MESYSPNNLTISVEKQYPERKAMIGYTILSAIKAAQMASFHGWASIICLAFHIPATRFGKSTISQILKS